MPSYVTAFAHYDYCSSFCHVTIYQSILLQQQRKKFAFVQHFFVNTNEITNAAQRAVESRKTIVKYFRTIYSGKHGTRKFLTNLQAAKPWDSYAELVVSSWDAIKWSVSFKGLHELTKQWDNMWSHFGKIFHQGEPLITDYDTESSHSAEMVKVGNKVEVA